MDTLPAPPAPARASVRVPFTLAVPGARAVSVAVFLGDRQTPPNLHRPDRPALAIQVVELTETEPGRWSVEIDLPPGWCEYSFLVDGTWRPDPEAPATWPDGAGGVNSFRHVAASAPTAGTARSLRPRTVPGELLRAV